MPTLSSQSGQEPCSFPAQKSFMRSLPHSAGSRVSGTYWGPGKIAGAATPYFKFKAYYGHMPEPILIKDQSGRWIPVKPFPMAVMNQKTSTLQTRILHGRHAPARPSGPEKNGRCVGVCRAVWRNAGKQQCPAVDPDGQIWHEGTKDRSCDWPCLPYNSCRGERVATWEYSDPGALPSSGRSQRGRIS